MRVTHAFTSAKSDSGDATLIQPSNWNADHTVTGPIALPQTAIQTGRYYYAFGMLGPVGSTVPIGNFSGTMYAAPFIAASSVTWTKIGIYCSVGQAGKKARLGIYSTGTDGLPGTLVVDAGEVDLSSNDTECEATISQALTANTLYWLAVVAQSGTAELMVGDKSMSGHDLRFMFGDGAVGGALAVGAAVGQTYGALPSSFGSSFLTIDDVPLIWMRK